jgi:GTPase involved in cell partitioning and DNA repair
MTLSCHLPLEYFENTCFIDTPGYNPAGTDNYTAEDKRTSSEYLKRANILIWMIGLDPQGTIPASDLDFLSELGLDDKKLYVVANKADLRSKSELEDILDEISESLEDYDIEYCGISAFSAKRNEEYLYKQESLFDFLQKENNQVGEQKKIKKTIKEVLDKYKKAIEDDVQNAENMKSDLHSLDLDLLETGYDFDAAVTEKINTRLAGLQQIYDVKKLEKQLKTLDGLDKRINAVVDDFFKSINP